MYITLMTTLDVFQFFEIDYGRRCSVNMDVFFPTFLLDNEYADFARRAFSITIYGTDTRHLIRTNVLSTSLINENSV